MLALQSNAQLVADLHHVFRCFPLSALRHVRDNRHRLIRGVYTDGRNGCLFFLLSETLVATQRIASKSSLMLYFAGRPSGADHDEVYQPAKWIVRWVDGEKVTRYDGAEFNWEIALRCLDEQIAERTAAEQKPLASAAIPSPATGERRVTTPTCAS
jgi:hypothetical protein